MDLINETDRDKIQQVIKSVGENRSKRDNGNAVITKIDDLKEYNILSNRFYVSKSVMGIQKITIRI